MARMTTLAWTCLWEGVMSIWDPEMREPGYTYPPDPDEELRQWMSWFDGRPQIKYIEVYPEIPGRDGEDPRESDPMPVIAEVFGIVGGILTLLVFTICLRRRCQGQQRAHLVAPHPGRQEEGEQVSEYYDDSWTRMPQSPSLPHRKEEYGWDRNNISEYATVVTSRCLKIACSYREQTGIDGAIWNAGFTSGRHVFAVMWPRDQRVYYNAQLVLGIGYPLELHTDYSRVLIGGNRESVGFNLIGNNLWFDGYKVRRYPKQKRRDYCLPTLFYMYVDFDQDKLMFGSDEEYWGVALDFSAVRKDRDRSFPLFPMLGFRKIHGKFMMFYKGFVPENLSCSTAQASTSRSCDPPEIHYLRDVKQEHVTKTRVHHDNAAYDNLGLENDDIRNYF